MKKKLIICGDSFSIGIGCTDLSSEPFGSLLSNELDLDLINLAKGSSTNLSIYLQAKYAIEHYKDTTELIIVSSTSYDRVEWFPEDYTSNAEISNTDVNYHQYPPYGQTTYHVMLDNPLKNDTKYTGAMFTDNYRGIVDYWENFANKGNTDSEYYARFKDEPKDRMKLLYDYYLSIYDHRISRINSMGVLTMAHQLLKSNNINHLILTHEPAAYSCIIDDKNIARVSWGELSVRYPDELNTLHTSPTGHCVAFMKIMSKLRLNAWAN